MLSVLLVQLLGAIAARYRYRSSHRSDRHTYEPFRKEESQPGQRVEVFTALTGLDEYVWAFFPPLTRIACTQPGKGRVCLQTRAYSTTQATPPALEDASTSKCPVARIVNGTKDLLQNFSHQTFSYTPFDRPAYQASSRCNALPFQ